MSGRDIALCVIAGLTAASLAGSAAAGLMIAKRKGLPGDAVLVLGPSLVFGLWALLGWAWLAIGAIR